ncbi:MAG: hypothetical protein ABSH28_24975 [Acidobacteriota bacterium]|jgi:hypothetical protein
MSLYMRFLQWLLQTLAFLSCMCMTAIPLRAQVQKLPTEQQTEQAGKPIRVTVGLVQTDVMVFNRQGHFVPDLRTDQFELKVDGRRLLLVGVRILVLPGV